MINKLIVIPNDIEDINELRNVGVTTFLLPINDYSIGYNTFSVEQINEISEIKYLLINRILNTKELDELKKDIKLYKKIQGIFFEDIGVFELFKNDKIELINFQTHFGTNYHSINFMLNLGMTSYVVANDLTYNEISEITDNVVKPVVLFIFGQSEVMYSRRNLLSNFKQYNNLNNTGTTIKEKISKVEFDLKENKNGTYLFDHNYYNGTDLMKLTKNINYYLINGQNIEKNKLVAIINLIASNKNEDIKLIDSRINDGFLYKETIYRVKGDNQQ